MKIKEQIKNKLNQVKGYAQEYFGVAPQPPTPEVKEVESLNRVEENLVQAEQIRKSLGTQIDELRDNVLDALLDQARKEATQRFKASATPRTDAAETKTVVLNPLARQLERENFLFRKVLTFAKDKNVPPLLVQTMADEAIRLADTARTEFETASA